MTANTQQKMQKVLVVEDEILVQLFLVKLLEGDGLWVEVAADGQEAITKLQATLFDLVLLDLILPDMHGKDILLQMKADDRLKAIPTIILTAMHDQEAYLECLNHGAVDYITKPVNPLVLTARIRNLFREVAKPSTVKLDRQKNSRHAIRNSLTIIFMIMEELEEAIQDPEQRALVQQAIFHVDKIGDVLDLWRNDQKERIALIRKVAGNFYKER